jgi:hypothetical protein
VVKERHIEGQLCSLNGCLLVVRKIVKAIAIAKLALKKRVKPELSVKLAQSLQTNECNPRLKK